MREFLCQYQKNAINNFGEGPYQGTYFNLPNSSSDTKPISTQMAIVRMIPFYFSSDIWPPPAASTGISGIRLPGNRQLFHLRTYPSFSPAPAIL